MQVDPARAAAKVDHKGRTFFFCCGGCAKKFSEAPEKYLSGLAANPREMSHPVPNAMPAASGLVTIGGAGVPAKGPAPAMAVDAGKRVHASHEMKTPQGAAVEFTCPMHPEV